MIEIKNLSKTYLSKKKVATRALKKANATFNKGEIVSILGASGSGKTTLLNLISGFDKSNDGGEIIIDGISTKTFKEKNWDNYRSFKVGYIFQDNCLIDHLCALDNVCMSMSFAQIPTRQRVKLAKEALKKVGLEGLENKFPNELSGGQQQLVTIARSIVKDPDIILADEPTGSLDTQTSKKVLDVLTKISTGKILVIASHNEKLVREYSSRILYLEDGNLRESSDSSTAAQSANQSKTYLAGQDKKTSATIILQGNKVKTKKSRMSIFAGMYDALNCLWYRKVKSFLMFSVGAVGVIVVSLVLAFSNGLNSYITDIQDNTLAQYPITFDQTRDLQKVDSYVKAEAEKSAREKTEYETKTAQREKAYKEARANDRVFLNNRIGAMMSTSGESTTASPSSTVNDLCSLKKYLDTNPDNFNDNVIDIEYAFRTSPVIYSNTSNGSEEVFPANSMFGSLGSSSGKTSATGSSKKQGMTSANSAYNAMSSMGPLPSSEQVYRDDECLVSGHWPNNPYELLLVLGEDGTVDDTLLYYLGMRDFNAEVAPLIEKYERNEKVEWPGQLDTYAYSDFVGRTLKMINPSDCFAKDGDVWVDMSSDEEFMKNVLNNAKVLKIAGVVLPKSGSRTASYLKQGVLFPYKLYEESINQTKNSPIVQDQLNHPDIDVLSGASFAYLEQAKSIADRLGQRRLVHFNLDMLLSSIKINPEALDFKKPASKSKEMEITEEELIKMLEDLLKDPEFQEFIYDITKEGHFDEATLQACIIATQKYLEYVEEMKPFPPLSPEQWFETPEGKEVVDLIVLALPEAMKQDITEFLEKYGPKFIESFIEEFSAEVAQFLSDLFEMLLDDSGPSLIEFDEEKFSKSMGINITANDISQLMLYMCGATEHTYQGNLADFGYDSLEDPVSIAIYPKDYQSKTEVVRIIDDYNSKMNETNQENKFVTYNDDAASVIGAAQTVVALVAGVIIFFLSSIFVSSTLLVGVIFGLSTISRRREVGIMRALGARKRDIIRMFNCETAMIGMLSGVLGVLIAMLICSLINSALNLGFDITILPFTGAAILIVVSIALMLIAGLVPAIIASKKDPVKAIRGL